MGSGPVVCPPPNSTKVHFFRLLILYLFQNFRGQAPNSPGVSSLVHISSQMTPPPKSGLGTGLKDVEKINCYTKRRELSQSQIKLRQQAGTVTTNGCFFNVGWWSQPADIQGYFNTQTKTDVIPREPTTTPYYHQLTPSDGNYVLGKSHWSRLYWFYQGV